MTLRRWLKEPGNLIRTGLVFLILASLAKWFLRPGAGLSDGVTDGVTGLLYGISMGCLLLGIRRNSRRSSAAG